MLNILSLAIALGLLAAQLPQTPVFRGSTDVVVVDVQVVGRDSAPVADLTAADFSLRIDGKPRPITSVSFERIADKAAASRPGLSGQSGAPPAAAMSTLSRGQAPAAPSYIMFVIDPGVMRPEPSRILFDQAAKFMTTLAPDHAVGLLVVPARRPQYPFSQLRQPVAAEFRRQLGGLGGVGQSEAQVVASIGALEAAIDALRDVDGRRTLVYFCDAMPDFAQENMKDVAFHANAANVAISIVASDALVIPTVSSRSGPPPPRPGGEFGSLPLLSDLTGGTFYRRVVTGAMVFDRLERELSAQYVLTFDVQAGDRDGKRHKIDVKVARKSVDVRFRQEFVR